MLYGSKKKSKIKIKTGLIENESSQIHAAICLQACADHCAKKDAYLAACETLRNAGSTTKSIDNNQTNYLKVSSATATIIQNAPLTKRFSLTEGKCSLSRCTFKEVLESR